MQGPISINVGCVCSRVHESASRGYKGANEGHESALSDCRGAQRGRKSIHHSHGLNNTLTAVRKFLRMLVDSRGLDNAFEAVKVSAEAMRMSIEAVPLTSACSTCQREKV